MLREREKREIESKKCESLVKVCESICVKERNCECVGVSESV